MSSPHPFFQALTPTLHIAHRGGAGLFPENTLAAFRGAVEQYRTQMLELDVHLSRDGELVVSHDGTVDRCTEGSGEIAHLTVSKLQSLDAGYRFSPDGGRSFPFRGQGVRIPRLQEVLEAFPGLPVNVELKVGAPGVERAFAELIRRCSATARVCCGSESDELGARLFEALPEASHFYPRQALTQLVLALKSGRTPPEESRYAVLDMPLSFQGMRLVDRPLLEAARGLGKWVNVWTIDEPAEMRRLIRDGVGGIMTDRPDLLRAALDQRAG